VRVDRPSSEQIHVALIDLPRMSRELVAGALLAEREIEVVTGFDARKPPDVAIIGGRHDEELPERALELLHEHPSMRVLTLADDGAETYVYELRPHRVLIGELSPAALLEAVLDVRKAAL
jgi:hypothetical protein